MTLADALVTFIRQHPRLLVLTGAGISTDSGIPDYRDRNGQWKRKQPIQHGDFMANLHARQRYWGRSLVGWPVMQRARPNAAHRPWRCLSNMAIWICWSPRMWMDCISAPAPER